MVPQATLETHQLPQAHPGKHALLAVLSVQRGVSLCGVAEVQPYFGVNVDVANTQSGNREETEGNVAGQMHGNTREVQGHFGEEMRGLLAAFVATLLPGQELAIVSQAQRSCCLCSGSAPFWPRNRP
jgi:hypothetical protein